MYFNNVKIYYNYESKLLQLYITEGHYKRLIIEYAVHRIYTSVTGIHKRKYYNSICFFTWYAFLNVTDILHIT